MSLPSHSGLYRNFLRSNTNCRQVVCLTECVGSRVLGSVVLLNLNCTKIYFSKALEISVNHNYN